MPIDGILHPVPGSAPPFPPLQKTVNVLFQTLCKLLLKWRPKEWYCAYRYLLLWHGTSCCFLPDDSVVGSLAQMPASAYFDLLVSVLLCLECVIAYIFIFQKSFTAAHRLVSVAIITALAYSIFLCSKRLLDHSLTGWIGVSFDDVFLPLMSLVAIISFVLSVINSWHSKRNVTFQITHNAGAFSFNPRLYSSAELKHFAAQVKTLKAGDANG